MMTTITNFLKDDQGPGPNRVHVIACVRLPCFCSAVHQCRRQRQRNLECDQQRPSPGQRICQLVEPEYPRGSLGPDLPSPVHSKYISQLRPV